MSLVVGRTAIVLVVPACPDPALAANDRGQLYRYKRSNAVLIERFRATVLLRNALDLVDWDGFALAYPVSVAFRFRPGRVFGKKRVLKDADNMAAAAKPWLDAMVDIGLLVNDSPKWVRRVSYEVDTTEGPEYCEVTAE